MKSYIRFTAIIAAILSLSLSSCKKYEEGPAFSLVSKKARLEGAWEFESYTYDGLDYSSNFVAANGANYEFEIEKDGKYYQRGTISDNGTWELGEDKDDIRFTSSKPGAEELSYRILRLTSKELWLRYTNTNGVKSITKLKQ